MTSSSVGEKTKDNGKLVLFLVFCLGLCVLHRNISYSRVIFSSHLLKFHSYDKIDSEFDLVLTFSLMGKIRC